jgi:anaerobic magnesium-protoporphyrin IX monomethyl ester cyclase
MKFSFVNPAPSSDTPNMVTSAWPPLGMLYIAGILTREGIEVSILDQSIRNASIEQAIRWVKKENPDIVGFSVCGSSAREAFKVVEAIKKEMPDITTVLGNYHATFNAERILKKYASVDVIARGEGEYTSLDLVKCLQKKHSLKEVDGITFRNKDHIVSTPDRPLIKNIDELPFPNRSLMNAEYTSLIHGIKAATRRFTTVVSSRGCPFQCTFCGCRKFARGVWRPRTVENIMKELECLKSEGYEQFLFVDDNFTLNTKRVVDFCTQMRKNKMDMEWFCDSRVDQVSYDMFREMVKAGCKILYFGIESGNQRILNYYKKGITPDQSRAAVKKARKAGMDVIVGSFIVGAPDETRKEVETTLRFAHELDIDVPQLNILGAFTGTDLWKEVVSKGWVDEETMWETGAYVASISPHAVPFDELRRMVFDYFKGFYIRPELLTREILRTLKSSYRFSALITNMARFSEIAENVQRGVRLD